MIPLHLVATMNSLKSAQGPFPSTDTRPLLASNCSAPLGLRPSHTPRPCRRLQRTMLSEIICTCVGCRAGQKAREGTHAHWPQTDNRTTPRAPQPQPPASIALQVAKAPIPLSLLQLHCKRAGSKAGQRCCSVGLRCMFLPVREWYCPMQLMHASRE